MRDRLIELITQGDKTFADKYTGKVMSHIDELYGFIADYLLANGVIVPPCKVGDMVYEICLGKLSGQKTIKQSKVTAIKITDKLTITLDYTTNFYDTDIGRWLFVGNNAKEEAEQALKGGEG